MIFLSIEIDTEDITKENLLKINGILNESCSKLETTGFVTCNFMIDDKIISYSEIEEMEG
jgi:hypothetical protein